MTTYGPCYEKTCFWGFANNKGADHLRSLISTFIIRFLESIICKLATDENSIFQLVSVAEQAGLNLTGLKPRRQVFSGGGTYKVTPTIKSCMHVYVIHDLYV